MNIEESDSRLVPRVGSVVQPLDIDGNTIKIIQEKHVLIVETDDEDYAGSYAS